MERRRLVDTSSSSQPPQDETEVRWRQHPVLAGCVRVVVIAAPLAAATATGIAASRLWRPHSLVQTLVWLVWTGAASLAVLTIADACARRLLPLHRLLQLCLVFPDRAPSRLRLAVRAARSRRPERLVAARDAPTDAAAAAARIVELLAALATHDRRTRGHSERVCAYTSLVAEQMDLSQYDRDRLMWVALVHDVGKLHVPSRLLNKPARPTVAEWQVLQAHPEEGDRITSPLREWLGPWSDAVLEHHERYDGRGYPHGLQGEQICLGARIIAVTDAFEVMTAPRPYRRPVDAQSARSELARHAGSQFDPNVVRQFLAVGLPELRRAMGLVAWVAQVPFLRSWPKLQSTASATSAQASAATAAAATAGILLSPAPHAHPTVTHEASAKASTPRVLHEPPNGAPGGIATSTSSSTSAAASGPGAAETAPAAAGVVSVEVAASRSVAGTAATAASPPAGNGTAQPTAATHPAAGGHPTKTGHPTGVRPTRHPRPTGTGPSTEAGHPAGDSQPTPTGTASHAPSRPPATHPDDESCNPHRQHKKKAHGRGHHYGWSRERRGDRRPDCR